MTATMIEMPDGIIEPGTDRGAVFGLDAERFGGSWLWKQGNRIMISFIISHQPGRGHFSALVKALLAEGYEVAVPTPMGLMRSILARWGFKQGREFAPEMGEWAEVWSKKP